MQESGYALWEAVEVSPSREARAQVGEHFTVIVAQFQSGRFLLDYGETVSGKERTSVAPVMSQSEVEEELRDLALPVSPTQRVWEPLQEQRAVRRDEEYYSWSVQAEEREAKKT